MELAGPVRSQDGHISIRQIIWQNFAEQLMHTV
jgi:hypothetical protein